MKRVVKPLSLFTLVALVSALLAVPALAGTRPVVSGLSAHKGAYWGGRTITVYGRNFSHVEKVMFGLKQAHSVHVLSSTRLTVRDPWHSYGTVHVRVVTSSGWSYRTSANTFVFARPTMNSKIQGGLTATQEQQISSRVRRSHHGVYIAPRGGSWTAARGWTAMKRAESWLGLPYSWAGGNGYGPTTGVCAHNGGDLDCHIVGFDCSGLTQHAWWPYKHLAHYAATQHWQAGRFHPAIGQLTPGDLVFFSGYIAGGIGHTAVYAGGGWVIQAEQSGTLIKRSRLTDVIAHSGVYRGATRPLTAGQQAPGPVVSSITPQVSVNGGYLNVYGRNLRYATSVSIAGHRIYSFAYRSSTHLAVKVPAHSAGSVSVYVYNRWGTAARHVSYVGAPAVSALTPTSGPTAGGTRVTLSGAYLTPVSKVLVGTAAVPFVHTTYGRLVVTMPAHAAGAATIRVYSRFGWSNARTFTYLAPPPPTTQPPAPAATNPAASSSSASSSSASSSSAPSTSGSPSSSPPSSSNAPTSEPPSSDAPTSDPASSSDAPTSSDSPSDGGAPTS